MSSRVAQITYQRDKLEEKSSHLNPLQRRRDEVEAFTEEDEKDLDPFEQRMM